ncbi:MAG: hypothetical protein IPL50_15090 [Chitinophagaceae bacterium]|nr:hypothetical protein [Chitinophagaceae bacterium]
MGYGLTISLVTILVRIIWVFAGTYWQNIFKKKKKEAEDSPDNTESESTWKNVLVVAWTGTRGVISLAAALALPLVLQGWISFSKGRPLSF